MKQSFNITEAATIAKDLVQDAKNFTRRTNYSALMEIDHIRYFTAKFTLSNINLHQAMEMQAKELRTKRNIFGSILSTLTGLVTEEELKVEQEMPVINAIRSLKSKLI